MSRGRSIRIPHTSPFTKKNIFHYVWNVFHGRTENFQPVPTPIQTHTPVDLELGLCDLILRPQLSNIFFVHISFNVILGQSTNSEKGGEWSTVFIREKRTKSTQCPEYATKYDTYDGHIEFRHPIHTDLKNNPTK